MVFGPPPNPEFFIHKTKGNKAAYKFTSLGAKSLIQAFCYSAVADNFIRYCVKLSQDTAIVPLEARHFLARVLKIECERTPPNQTVFVVEADSVNLLVGIKIIRIDSTDLVKTIDPPYELKDAVKNGLFFKFSGQGAESVHLQHMSDACFSPSPRAAGDTRRHISQIFLSDDDRSFRHACKQPVLMPYHTKAQPRIFPFNVIFSVSLPIATVNFNMNRMLRSSAVELGNAQTLAGNIFSELDPRGREMQFMSASPLASGEEFMVLLNRFENDNPENKAIITSYRHRIMETFYNSSLAMISPGFRQLPVAATMRASSAASPRPASSPMMPPAPAASPRPASSPMMPPAPAASPRPPSSPMMPPAPGTSPRPPSSPMMPPAPGTSPRPPSSPIVPPGFETFCEELGNLICMATGIGFALGYFHQRSAIQDPKTRRYMVPRHRDLHLRNIMVCLKFIRDPNPRDVNCEVNMIDNADFWEAFDPDGFLIPEKLGELGYDLIYTAFIALHKTGGIHIGSQISGAQFRARGHQVMTATDFIHVVFRSLFFGYLQSFPDAFHSLDYIFKSNWILAIGRSARKGVSITPDLADFKLLGMTLVSAASILGRMVREHLPPPPMVVRG